MASSASLAACTYFSIQPMALGQEGLKDLLCLERALQGHQGGLMCTDSSAQVRPHSDC